jgi:integrase
MGTRTLFRLSALQARRASKTGRHADGGGLYLQINEAGNKSWVFKYTYGGRPREMGLGGCCAVTLELARDLAAQQRSILARGGDPIAARQLDRHVAAQKASQDVTLQTAALRCLDRKKAAWRCPKHAQQWWNTLEQYVLPAIGKLSVREIETRHIVEVLEPIWLSKYETASRIRERLEAILDTAKTAGWREGENPARWRGHLQNLLPQPPKRQVQHHPALPYLEIGDFMRELRGQVGFSARALELTILTAARTSEVLNAAWHEFDLSNGIWTIPAERMKAGREHRVPLSEPTIVLLRKLLDDRIGEPVFPGWSRKQPLSNMAMLKVLHRMDRRDITVHGFRSTFRDWAAEQTDFPREVAEMALAHSVGNAVEAAYRRGDLFEKRAKLMAAWASYCGVVRTDAKVLPLCVNARL